MSDYDAIAISFGWFKLKRGWYHPLAEQYPGFIGYPVCYATSKELCEMENLNAVKLADAIDRLRQYASVLDSNANADASEPNLREDIEAVCLAAAPAASGGVLAIEDIRALQIIKLVTEQAEHIRALTASPLPADGGLSIEVRLRAVRSTAILECANALAKLYPDNASTNAFCAAIRSLVDRPLPADGVRDREAIARIVDPRAFQQNADALHRHCSPFTVDVVQNLALAKADAILAALASPHVQGEG